MMVPRPEVVGLSVELDLEEAMAAMLESPYTRYPVFRESLDEIVGILHVRDLVASLHNGSRRSPRSLAELAAGRRTSCPRRRTSARSLAEFRKTNQHMAVVVDEYGATAGDRHARGPARGDRRRDRGRVRPARRVGRADRRDDGSASTASFPIDDFNEQFGTALEHEDFHTVAGYVFGHLGRAAAAGRRGPRQRAALHRARDERLADPAPRGRVPRDRAGRPGRDRSRVDRVSRALASPTARGRLAPPPPRLRPLRRGHGRDGVRDRDVVRRDRLAGLRDPLGTRSTSGSSGWRCSCRCRCSPSRRGTSATGTRDARCSRSRRASTPRSRSACSR